MTEGLDVKRLYNSLDKVREAHGVTWYKLAKYLKIDRSIFTRMKNGGKPDADTLTKVLVWAGLEIKQFAVKNNSK